MSSPRTPKEWSRLVEQVVRGDETATVQFAADIREIVLRFLRVDGMLQGAAVDLAVSCTTDIVLALPGYKDEGKFESWMFRIVRNCRAELRRNRPNLVPLNDNDRGELSRHEEQHNDECGHGQNGQLSGPVHSAVESVLRGLSDIDQRLIEGRVRSVPLSFQDLGKELGLSEGTARTRCHRVMKQVKARLQADVRIQHWLDSEVPRSPPSSNSSNEEK